MNANTKRQLIDAVKNNNGFAITLLAVYLINSKEDIEFGINLILRAADEKNVLWAKNLKIYLRGFGEHSVLPIEHNALIDSDTREQLENYIAEGDYWAMTIWGELLYQGRVIPRDRKTAEELLVRASNLGCLYASDLVVAYGLSGVKGTAFDIIEKFKTKTGQKYWMQK